MKIFIALILAIIINFFSVNLFAQYTWQDVGPNNGFSTGNAFYTKIASNSKGELFVAYQDVAANGITVKKFEQGDNNWYTIGAPGFSSGSISKISLAINQDTLYVSYMTTNGAIVVQKFNGIAWQLLGGVIESQGDYPSLAFNPTNNIPYIAYSVTSNGNKGTLKKYDKATNTWKFVNSNSNYYSTNGAYYNSLVFNSGTPLVAFNGDVNSINIKSFESANWVTLGNQILTTGTLSDITLKINPYNSIPYLGLKDGNSKVSVYNFSTSLWNIVGAASFTNPISHLSLCFDNSGKTYIAFGDQGNSSKISVMNFNGISWTQIGTTSSIGGTDYSDIIFHNNTPTVVFPDNGYAKKVVVKKFSNCVQNIPSIAGNTTQYCVGSKPNSLTATPNAGYFLLWWGENPLGGTSIAASITPDISTVGVKSYYVSQTDGLGCNTARAKIDINTVNKPTATISSSNTSICRGNSGSSTITLTGTPPFNFSYNDGNVNEVASHNPFTYIINTPPLSTDKKHEILFISDNLCSGVIINNIVTFNVTTPQIASFNYPNSSYCKNTANPSAVLNVGSIAGTFSSTPGLIFLNNTIGKIDLVNSTEGTYTIKNTLAPNGGCGQVVDQFTITIKAALSITTLPVNASICTGGSNNFILSTSGGSILTYQWLYSNDGLTYSGIVNDLPAGASYGNITTSSLLVSGVTVTGPNHFYKCIVNDVNGGCNAVAAKATLTVNAPPIATFNYTGASFCANAANPLPTFSDGGIAGIFSSTSGLKFVDSSTGQINLTTSIPGNYTVTNTVAALGCTNAVYTKSIKINTPPSATISGNATICAGSKTNLNFSLTGTSPWNLVYTDGTTPIIISGITNSMYSFNVSPSSNKTYTISSINDATTCSGTKSGSANTTVNQLPTSNISGDTTICKGGTSKFSMNFTGKAPFEIIYHDGFSLFDTLNNINTNFKEVTIMPSITTNYTVTSIKDANNCIGKVLDGQAKITVNQLPYGTITGNSSICKGSKTPVTVTLTGLGPWGVEIFDSKNKDTLKFPIFVSPGTQDLSPTESNTYTLVSITDINNKCKYRGTGLPNETVNVIVEDYPLAPTVANLTYCQNESSNPLTATINANCIDNWYTSKSGGSKLSTSPTPITSNIGSTSYFVSQKTKLAGCESPRSTLDVTVNKIPAASFSGNQTIIKGDTATIPVTLEGTAPWNLTYSDGTTSKTVSNINLGYKLIEYPTVTTTYSLTRITDSSNCTGVTSGSYKITVTQKNVIITQQPIEVNTCEGKSTSFQVKATGGSSFKWQVKKQGDQNFVDISNISIYSGTTNDTLTIITTSMSMNDDEYRCIVDGIVISDPAKLLVNAIPKATFSYNTNTICKASPNNPVAILASEAIAGTFTASNASLIFTSNLSGEINLTNTPSGNYTITNNISAANGCDAVTYNTPITISDIPNATMSILGQSDKTVDICDTDQKQIWLNISGSKPITIYTSVNGIEKDTVISGPLNNFKFRVSPNVTTEYKILSIKDNVCTTPINLTETIKINVKSSNGRTKKPTIISSGTFTNCTNSNFIINVTNDEPGATYQWYRDGRLIVGATKVTLSLATYGKYSVNNETCYPSDTSNVLASNFGPIPTISADGMGTNYATLNSTNSGSYQWYINDYLILGETNQHLNILFNGNYKVGVNNGCTIFSDIFTVNDPVYPNSRVAIQFNSDSSVSLNHDLVNSYNIVPNPSNGEIHIIGNNMTLNYKIIIKNITGNMIYQHENKLSSNTMHNISSFPIGLYIVEVIVDNKSYFSKLVKE